MAAEYDRKFEEMKKYVPFLESMITRLESNTSGTTNPRQAQLDKIRSLRDLLLDKKKRMKMDNLLKCEQVLVNLYAKVEQRDTFSTTAQSAKEVPNLEGVRNKLKNIIKKEDEQPGTLPEIARANEAGDIGTAGTKEPALFQRRPNKAASPGRSVTRSPPGASKRNYTRVLVSPERKSPDPWLKTEHGKDKPLFSRRSPRRSPKRYSPAYSRKERRKESKPPALPYKSDLNITLKVPEESLNSLNTKDFLSRIITCSDSDVDIDSLRELRTQILDELKHTGVNVKDDISDLILRPTKSRKKKKKKPKQKEEVEEGELSDSESEAIEDIYGSLVILDKADGSGQVNSSNNDEQKQNRKIQIRLVINSEKTPTSGTDAASKTINSDSTDFEMYKNDSKSNQITEVKNTTIQSTAMASGSKKDVVSTAPPEEISPKKICEVVGELKSTDDKSEENVLNEKEEVTNKSNESNLKTDNTLVPKENHSKNDVPFKPNFYKPLNETETNSTIKSNANPPSNEDNSKTDASNLCNNLVQKDVTESNTKEVDNKTQSQVEIPLLNEPSVASHKPKESVVSEIDILQALKNEILSESISIPSANATTPTLHQPKLTKVASAQEITPKKRISIENYKKKSADTAVTPLFSDRKDRLLYKQEQIKKQSLKLTEKEFERFKFALHSDLSSDDDIDDTSIDDIYEDLAPKSPDNEDMDDVTETPPVIIPADPVKNAVVNSKADVDMRTMISKVSPLVNSGPSFSRQDDAKPQHLKNISEKPKPVDPRIKRDSKQEIPRPVPPPVNFPNMTPNIPLMSLPNMSPCLTPIMTPNVLPNMTPSRMPNMTPSSMPNMTPSRMPNMTPNMTPNSRSFQLDEPPTRKHVYASLYSPRDYTDQSVTRDGPSARDKSDITKEKKPWEKREDDWKQNKSWSDRTGRDSSVQKEKDYQKSNKYDPFYDTFRSSRDRSEAPLTPSHPFGRSDCPPTPIHTFGRSDCPLTPSHSFGRSDCPTTPVHPFGRSDCPTTPSHPFGQSECPTTPSHHFGRIECPLTPSHSFGRVDCPSTPSHPFGRSEIPMSHSHSKSRMDRDPRLQRNSEHDTNSRFDDRDHGYRNYNDRNTSYNSYRQEKYGDKYTNYRERSVGRNDRSQHYSKERDSHPYGNERMSRFDGGTNRSDNYDKGYAYSRERNTDYHEHNKIVRYNEKKPQDSVNRERSVGRNMPSDDKAIPSRPRARSVGRNCENDTDNSLSVKPHAGRPFTIDTSINATFQTLVRRDKDKSVFEHIFDNRRQRASSVGRSLVPETNIAPSQSQFHSATKEEKNRRFRRACSVVRDVDSESSKTFSQIKADFKSFTTNICLKKQVEKPDYKQTKKLIENNESSQAKRHSYGNQDRSSKSAHQYSPRKNSRDPRFHRDAYSDARNKRKDNKHTSRDKNKYGIDYSSESIARGTVIETGFGIKNFKIPKIKRPVTEEPESKSDEKVEISKEKKEQKAQDVKQIEKAKKPEIKKVDKPEKEKIMKPEKHCDVKSIKSSKSADISRTKHPKQCELKSTNIDIGKRITRATKKIPADQEKLSDEEVIVKTRKSRLQISDSESEQEDSSKKEMGSRKTKQKVDNPQETSKKRIQILGNEKEKKIQNTEIKKQMDNKINIQDAELDTTFQDDLEMFPDNVVSDPVIDSINALIADLDDDIDTSKNQVGNNFASEISLDTMFDGITSQSDDDNSKQTAENISLSDINEFIVQDLNKKTNDGNLLVGDGAVNENVISEINNENADKIQNYIKANTVSVKKLQETLVTPDYKEDIVSTTGIGSENLNNPIENSIKDLNDESSEQCSAPDSTYDGNKLASEDNLPDSTNEANNENPDITSSRDTDTKKQKQTEQTSSSKDDIPNVDSIESILSLLQNKAKMKELLNKFTGENNDKVKKTLEKLSEIVLHDKDSNDKTEEEPLKPNVAGPSEDEVVCPKDNEENIVTKEHETETENKIQTATENKIQTSTENKVQTTTKNKVQIATEDKVPTTTEDKVQIATEYKVPTTTENKIQTSTENKVQTPSEIIQTPITNNVQKQSEKNIQSPTENKVQISTKNKVQTPLLQNSRRKIMQPVPIIKKKKRSGRKQKKKPKNKRHPITPSRNLEEAGNVETTASKLETTEDNSESNVETGKTRKKMSRELMTLQKDIKEMFISNEILNVTGIRSCRLSKLVDEKPAQKGSANTDTEPSDTEKGNKKLVQETTTAEPTKTLKNKAGPKSKVSLSEKTDNESIQEKSPPVPKYKPGPKSKTKPVLNEEISKGVAPDPYAFETDSVNESIASKRSDDSPDDSSHSDNESLASSKSFGSTELLMELKKKQKRKRGSWQTGVIKSKQRKKKSDAKPESAQSDDSPQKQDDKSALQHFTIPDFNCFTDKNYCFTKSVDTYSCRLCIYTGNDIVAHYKKQHPHSEIPLSRLSLDVAKEAIDQCEEINIQAISKMPSKKLVCRFCFKEFMKKKSTLESFFWHVVSTHTGEYKQLCSECINIAKCPFNLDIPAPPKDVTGQLIGYICGKCNFTQISLENLKTHVIVRHNDEQTEVYTINLAVMSRKLVNNFVKRISLPGTDQPRVLRSSRSNQSMMTETSDDRSDITDSTDLNAESEPTTSSKKSRFYSPKKKSNMQSKITFENDDSASEVSSVKLEQEDNDDDIQEDISHIDDELCSESDSNANEDPAVEDPAVEEPRVEEPTAEEPMTSSRAEAPVTDIFSEPHFKVRYTDTGSKQFVCCINGSYHYKNNLLISMKRHLCNHKEKWDGYCCICKVIVMPQGQHSFKECWQHFLDKHIDELPVMEDTETNTTVESAEQVQAPAPSPPPRPYINVRPISQLQEMPVNQEERSLVLPKIESVVSLGSTVNEQVYTPPAEQLPLEQIDDFENYEEAQNSVMSKKHPIVLDTMMTKEKLVKVYKCAGSYCSFTTDSAEVALMHALCHQQIGGQNALNCAYCAFDCAGNAIDLVVHVFKHANCHCVCPYCFYRAVSGQLVVAHIARLHPAKPLKVLTATNAVPAEKDSSAMLPRNVAVKYYVCNQDDIDGACKFRTYISGKFCEHMERHKNSTEYTCYICFVSVQTPAELVQHMKVHDLNVYQCTWCSHAADNENELLAHSSTKHPTKQPQAYLRIITNKGGSSEYRVLPLASFNKNNFSIEEITPNNTSENPTKEAERSLQLEQLIGQTKAMFENTTASTIVNRQGVETHDLNQDAAVESLEIQESTQNIATQDLPTEPTVVETPKTPTHEVPILDISEQLTPKVKNSPALRHTEDVVYIAEDTTKQKKDTCLVIDLSDDDAPQDTAVLTPIQTVTHKEPATVTQAPTELDKNTESVLLLSDNDLFRCPKCRTKSKSSGGLKKHILSCYSDHKVPMPCAHCGVMTKDRDDLIRHYNKIHKTATMEVTCGICNREISSISNLKKHIKVQHQFHGEIEAGSVLNGRTLYGPKKSVGEPTTSRQAPKRKSSSSHIEPPQKMKRYGPQDVDRLPINPILDDLVYCSLCEFNTKVRLNMVRHLQLHAEQQPVPQTAPVNPVPHLETNEKHFDRMVNLASSSIVTRGPEKQTRSDAPPIVSLHIPAEAASRYPKYVPERQRHTCGAKGCSYISVDEAMLRCHWDTLHAGSNDFHCVHCPPYQQLDTSKPLTATRIIAHLKMHDTSLYACSSCTYYHYRKQILEKHVNEVHRGGKLMVVREEAVSTPTTAPIAPTMDLKPWQCGVCKFKSMLRPEVVDHCARIHQSKMQFKCSYCPFRTSTKENVQKHQTNSHPEKPEEVFYYYYREGSVADEPDGTPRWQRQQQKARVDSEVKTEVPDNPNSLLKPLTPQPTTPAVNIDLNIVKMEVDTRSPSSDETVEELCKKFGDFCEPNGIKYKCCLCNVVTENTREAMQSHLYEELHYRKWRCFVCTYKAFHKTGLYEHMASEHRGQTQDPLELPVDTSIEKWVAKLLDHQTKLIEKSKENFEKQRILPGPSTPSKVTQKPTAGQDSPTGRPKPSMKELEQAFGHLGVANNMQYCCPKCQFKNKDEVVMVDHLESELTKIRWCCSNCPENFQTYHEAQLHCKSAHDGQSAQPKGAVRDPYLRSSWVSAVIQVQKLSMKCMPIEPTSQQSPEKQQEPENSLLVVRFETDVPIPEATAKKRPAPQSPDSDEERLIIDEITAKRPTNKPDLTCPHCPFQGRTSKLFRRHMFNHFNLHPFACPYCEFGANSPSNVMQHVGRVHPQNKATFKIVPMPSGTPPVDSGSKRQDLVVCLECKTIITESETTIHKHNNMAPVKYARDGDKIYRCDICMLLWRDIYAVRGHFSTVHGGAQVECSELVLSLNQNRPGFNFRKDEDDYENSSMPEKLVAKKSTTKLPMQTVSKKSTTKLPCSDGQGYSHYGKSPMKLDDYAEVTTMMPFYNTLMPVTMKKLSEIINIEPKVQVNDIQK